MPGALSARCAIVVFGDRFLELLGNLKNHCGQGRHNQRQKGQLHRERLASAAAAPPVATADEAGIVLSLSCSGAPLAAAAAAGCFIIREVVAPPRPPPSANELKLRKELARPGRGAAQGARRSGRARPPDAIVETKTDDDDANDEATANERNRRLAEEIGAPVCLWGAADVRRERARRWIRKRKGRGQKRPGRGGNSPLRTTRRSPRPAPPMVAAVPPRSARTREPAPAPPARSCLRLR